MLLHTEKTGAKDTKGVLVKVFFFFQKKYNLLPFAFEGMYSIK